MKNNLLGLSVILFIFGVLQPINWLHGEQSDCFFGPEGGFSTANRERNILIEPFNTLASPTLTQPVLKTFESMPEGSSVYIAMYNFDDPRVLKQILRLVAKKNFTFYLLLDNVATWTRDIVKETLEKIGKNLKENPSSLQRVFVNLITPEKMEKGGRIFKGQNGEKIFGTMHEKIILCHGEKFAPLFAFNGSSNLSMSSEFKYAENRFFFGENPDVFNTFYLEFKRLWDHFSTPSFGGKTRLDVLELPIQNKMKGFEVLFTTPGSAADGGKVGIAERVIFELEKVDREGEIKIGMFSFAHFPIANKLIQLAMENPKLKIHILLDHSMFPDPEKPWMMSHFFEEKKRHNNLKNLSIRYKWRSNSYDNEGKGVALNHFRSPLWHHKMVLIDGKTLLTGSYNFSQTAENYNLENLMVFKKSEGPWNSLIDKFKKEFLEVWESEINSKNDTGIDYATLSGYPRFIPRVVQLKGGGELIVKIKRSLNTSDGLNLRNILDKGKGSQSKRKFLTFKELSLQSNLSHEKLTYALAKLKNSGLIQFKRDKGRIWYFLND